LGNKAYSGLNLNKERKYFLYKLLVVGVPVIIQNMITIGLNIVDTLMIGKLGEAQLAAVGSANQVYLIFASICFGLFSGAAVYVSQFWGIRDVKTVRKILGIDYLIGIVSSLIIIVLVLIFAPTIISWFAEYDEVIGYGSQYIRIVCISYLFMGISMTISFNCRAIQRMLVPTLVSAFALSLNTFLNYCLIYGHFGFEAMGIKGAAIATLVARILESVALLIYVYVQKDHPFHAKLSELMSFDKRLFSDVMRMAVPVVITEGSWSLSVALTFMAYGRISYAALAVVQVAEVVSNFFQTFYFGLGNSTAFIIGEALGRNEKEKADYYAKLSLKITWILNVVLTTALFLLRFKIAEIYDFNQETTEMLILTLAVWAFTIIPKMMTYLQICGILRGGGDTMYSMIVDASFNMLTQVPLAFIGVYWLKWPLHMIVGLVTIGEVIKMFICYFRIYGKKWMNVVTNVEY